MSYTVEFFETENLEVSENEAKQVLVRGEITNVETGNSIEFDLVPLTNEVAFREDWDEEYDEFWNQIGYIRAMGMRSNHRAFYLYKGIPMKVLQISRDKYSCFNELDGNFTTTYEVMMEAEPINFQTYQAKMADYAERTF